MNKSLRRLAWYTAIMVSISTLLGIGSIGQRYVVTPGEAVLELILSAPILIFAILTIIRTKDNAS